MNEDICCEICNEIIYTAYILEQKNKGHILCINCFNRLVNGNLRYFSLGVIDVGDK